MRHAQRRIAGTPAALFLLLLAFTPSTALAHPPPGIVVDDEGRVVFVEWSRRRILRLSAAGEVTVLAELNGRGEPFGILHHLEQDPAGNLYTLEDDGLALWRIDSEGRVEQARSAAATPGTSDFGSGGDPFTVDAGAVYYLGEDRASIVLATSDEAPRRLAGDLEGLHYTSLALGPYGNLHAAVAGGRVVRVSPQGTVQVLADLSRVPGAPSPYHHARGVAVHPEGGVVVAAGDRVLRVSPDGTVATVAELTGTDQASGVAVAPDGTIYVLSTVGDQTRVLKILPGGRVERLVSLGPSLLWRFWPVVLVGLLALSLALFLVVRFLRKRQAGRGRRPDQSTRLKSGGE